MTKTYPIIEKLADSVVVTARSTVEAQQAAGDAIGGDCTVVSVERVREGGIGGFFATELVRVVARPSQFCVTARELDAAMSSAEELVTSMRSSSPQFADRLMNELRLSDLADEPRVETVPLPDHEPQAWTRVEDPIEIADAYVAPAPTVPSATVTSRATAVVERPVTPIITPARREAPAAHDPRWSHQSLRALGLPDRIVDLAVRENPVEGPEWIVALMGAFRTICSPTAAGPTVMVGPSSANLARQLRLVSVDADELSESFSSVAIPNVSAKVARAATNNRFMHVMVGGRWHHLASIQAHIVSAATPGDLLEAVRVCCAWDATLGWSPVGDRYERIDEFTLVAHVRSVLYGTEQASAINESSMAAFS